MNDRIDPTDPADMVPEFVDGAFDDLRRTVLGDQADPDDVALLRTVFAAGFFSGASMAASLAEGLKRAANRTLDEIDRERTEPAGPSIFRPAD